MGHLYIMCFGQCNLARDAHFFALTYTNFYSFIIHEFWLFNIGWKKICHQRTHIPLNHFYTKHIGKLVYKFIKKISHEKPTTKESLLWPKQVAKASNIPPSVICVLLQLSALFPKHFLMLYEQVICDHCPISGTM